MSFYNTYVISCSTLHNWSKETNKCIPTSDIFGLNLVRDNAEPPGMMRKWKSSNPEATFNGEPFHLMTKVCFSRHKSRKERESRPFSPAAITKKQALEKLCRVAGLEIAVTDNKFYASVEPVELVIHGIRDVNTFIVSGTFRVVDEDKFLTAYNNGVGRRKSYGCGMLVVM